MGFNAKRILVTGATGSFGKAFVSSILKNDNNVERLIIFSRDELKQWEMQQDFPTEKYGQLRYFLGDIRDKERLNMAVKNIDTIVHAAALKHVPIAEYNPMEFIKTNIIGSENIINVALDNNVEKVISLSTDKAASPINLYGATKLCSDKLMIAANNIKGDKKTLFSVVRYGNVLGSRGSVIPLFLKQAENEMLSITSLDMTRFNITLDEGVNMVKKAISKSVGSEIIVPKLSSYRLSDLVEAIAPSKEYKIIGLRPGEKVHEELVTSSDSYSTVEHDGNFLIFPSNVDHYLDRIKGNYKKVEPGYSYTSNNNPNFLSVEEIRNLIKKNIDPNFTPF